MTALTASFNELLKQREAPPAKTSFSLEELDEFLKEAYRINSHIASLHSRLKDVRQAYLSTAPQRKSHLRQLSQYQRQQILTDHEREEVDANAKKMLRELNASIRTLADAEQLRHETELVVIRKKYVRGLGALGAWAAGDVGGVGGRLGGLGRKSKSKEHLEAEGRAAQLAGHREGVLWFLRQRLQRCVETQQHMMETRLTREVEKSRSVLAKARPGQHVRSTSGLPAELATHPGFQGSHEPASGNAFGGGKGSPLAHLEEEEKKRRQEPADLTADELQMFEKGSQDMLKYYESTLDKVMSAEKSLLEISELQTVLVNSLATQSAHVEQLVADSLSTEENVGGGNKELKKASEKWRPAKLTFFGAVGLCSVLVLWDLVI
ncbi:hypothetical protein RB594_006733 [Gaeumannomyces avenae]